MAKRKRSSLPPAFLANIEKMKAGKLGRGRRKKASSSTTKRKTTTRRKK